MPDYGNSAISFSINIPITLSIQLQGLFLFYRIQDFGGVHSTSTFNCTAQRGERKRKAKVTSPLMHID